MADITYVQNQRKYIKENESKMEFVKHNGVSPQKSLKKNAVLNMTKTLMSLVFPLITFPYASRVLGPVYIGKVCFAQSIVSYFSLIAALGISAYAVRETAKHRDDMSALSIFAKEIFFINMTSTLIAYCLFFTAVLAIPQLSEHRKLLCIVSGSILFTTIGMDWLYVGLEEFRYITIRAITFQFISLVLLFSLVNTQDDYLKYAGISVVSSAGSNLLNFIQSRKFIDFHIKARLKLRRHLKPMLTLFATNAAISIYTVLDTTMLGFVKGDESVGIYTAATKINRVVIMMITAATAVLLPRLSYFSRNGNMMEFLRIANRAVQFIILSAVPCAMGLFILSEPIVFLFSGMEYGSSVPAMKIMNAVIVFISLGTLMGGNILVSVGKERFTMFAAYIGATSNFILNIILIPKYGVCGAAAGSVCAEAFVMAALFVFGRKIVNWNLFLKTGFHAVLSALVMAVSVFAIRECIRNTAMQVFTAVFAGATVYFISLLVMHNELAWTVLELVRKRHLCRK